MDIVRYSIHWVCNVDADGFVLLWLFSTRASTASVATVLTSIWLYVQDPDKGIKNGCPCIVEIRGTQGCALVGDPARAVGECRDVAKAQP